MLSQFLIYTTLPFLAASSFVLVINKSDGTKIEVPTSEVVKMQFCEETRLEKPEPTVEVSGTAATLSWRAVDNASVYKYRLDTNPVESTADNRVEFQNLTAGEHVFSVYCCASEELAMIYRDSPVAEVRFTIENAGTTIPTTPGAKGSVFPPGVSREGGWIDVDKCYSSFGGNPEYESDNLMCWACSAAGVLQWWLDDYERTYGIPYPMAKPISAESQFYTTPVMDEFTKSFKDRGYNITLAVEWFAEGKSASERWNGECPFKPNYANRLGGFMGLSSGETASYYTYSNMFGRYMTEEGDNLSPEQFKIKLSRDLIDLLQQGPMGIGVVQSTHAINLWGVDYEVDADGNPIVTHFHITENSGLESQGNFLNTLQTDCKVSWGKNQYGRNRLYYMHPARSPYTCELTDYLCLKSWQYVNAE